RHRHPGAVGQHTTYRDEVAPIAVVLTGDEVDLHATFLGEKRCVDEGDGVLDHVGEHTLERGQLQHLDVVLDDLAAHLHVDAGGQRTGQGGEDPAELLGQRQPRLQLLGHPGSLDVDRVG